MPKLRDYHIFISHSWDYSKDYQTVCNWFQGATNFKLSNFSIPESKRFDTNEASVLKANLRKQIAACSCVLVMAGMYVNYSGWIGFEIDTAVNLGKPIIGIIPRGQERIPLKVQHAIEEVGGTLVGWNSTSVVQAVREYAL